MQKRTILKNIIVLILCFSLLFSVSAKQDKSNEISISLEYNKDSAYDADDNGEESLDGIVDLTVEKSKFSWKADENKVCTLWSIESLDDNRISKGCYGAENCCNFADLVSLKDSWKDDFYLNYGAFGATYNNIIHSQIMYVDYDINPNDAFAEIVSSDVEQLKANFQEPELGDNFRQCGETDVGVCEYGIQELKFDIWGKCLGSVDPDEEICDGLDNDCDGLTDEQLVQECGTDVGACVSGTQTCANGKWADCSGTYIGSSDEVCDGIDNDCDDEVDEGCECVNGVVRSCGSDIGECVSGTQKCAGGKWGQCKGSVASVSEECDGLDNDCDGFVDEDVTQECGEYHLGACKKGTQSCMTGEWGVCEGAVNPGFEICDNIDNDCDGKVDESLSRKCDGKGNQECSNGVWSQCKGEGKIIICHYPPGNPANKHTIEIDESAWPAHEEHGDTIGECDEEGCLPSLEICDGLDNDCDDEVDENLVRACGCDCAKTHILLVLDDNNNNEDIQDIDNLKSDFDALDIDYTFINEPTNGLTYDQIRNYDLVWFSNPGWPLDDINTLNALTQYVNEGNPVVMQGDDMTWAQGSATNNDMILFTGLKNINNGLDSDYTVTFGNDDHPLLNFLGGKSFTYKEDDIDTSTVYLDDVEVLASAVNKNDGSKKGPALVVRDLSEQGKGVIIVALLTFMEIEPRWHGTALTGNIVNWLLNKAGKCECGTDVGACTVSTQTCISGDWGVCEGIPPIHEICNGVDDDCNGKIDDGLICECHVGQTEICGTDTGQCKSGERTCLDGLWGECVGSINPIDEVCGDGRDNDCNNIIDENCCFDADGDTYLPASCGGDDCDDNNSLIHPGVEESCNSVDDDCDGFVDESLARICGDTDIGQCSFGLSTCFGGVWGACVGSIAASDEICNNIDDDCDGMIDEGLTQVCGSNIGQCVAGLQSCSSGIWGECIGSVDSSQEICDGLDNDCDGYFDDDISCTCLESE
ncbi:MAG: putative metal-binding motif-containing protein, partial [Nanoarchaeota archaeon]